MRKQFRDTVSALAEEDDHIVVILGDISHYLFSEFQKKHPRRFFNMGICESTLISVAAGLGAHGYFPFVHTIAPFITERSLEQIKLDLCYNQFGTSIVSCGSSFDYAWDGATHHCYADLAILRLLPHMEVVQRGSRAELDLLMRATYRNGKPKYFKLSDHPHQIQIPVQFGRAVVLKDAGAPLTVMTAGPLLGNVTEGCQDLDVNLVYFHTIKPIDTEVIARFARTRILVVHDSFGLSEAVGTVAERSVFYHGLHDEFYGCYGTVHDIRRLIGLDPAGIREAVTRQMRQVRETT